MLDVALDLRIPFAKADDDGVHTVLAPVLIPEVEDAQGDIISAAEIEKTAHDFMKWSRISRVQHVAAEVHGLDIVETYLAPVKLKLGGVTVTEGTWLMKMRIEDPAIWGLVVSGELTGMSVKGTAQTDDSVDPFDQLSKAGVGDAVNAILEKARRLHDANIWEVSLVDLPAIKTPFLVVKRDIATAVEASGFRRPGQASAALEKRCSEWKTLAMHFVGLHAQHTSEAAHAQNA